MSTVMSFTTDGAFDHLRENGSVYTFREDRRTNPDGDVWISRGRGEPKEFDATCEEIETNASPTADTLDAYASESGFGTSENWRETIREVNDGLPANGFIYRIEREDP